MVNRIHFKFLKNKKAFYGYQKKLFTPSLWARFFKNITELALRFFL